MLISQKLWELQVKCKLNVNTTKVQCPNSHTGVGSAAIIKSLQTWPSQNPTSMKWHHNKRKFMPLALKNVMCPWYFKMFTEFAHPVRRVSSQTCFLLQICLHPQGCLRTTSLLPRHLSLPGMNFLYGKRVLLGWLASHLCSLEGNTSGSITRSLNAPWWWFRSESFL